MNPMIEDPDAPSVTEQREQIESRILADLRSEDEESAAQEAIDIISDALGDDDRRIRVAVRNALEQAMIHAARGDGPACCRALLAALSDAMDAVDPSTYYDDFIDEPADYPPV
jgi:hypothetical protein